jgi:uncharacterized membrane protein YoaK (UPF0700 family)
MSVEALLWGLFPALLAVASVIASALMAVKARRVFHSAFSVIVVVLDALALWMLFAIFVLGGWPTFLPHVFIGVTVLIVLAQTILFWRRRHDVA